MHCPKCGQQQITEETRFCSRCGFLLTGVLQLVANDGQLPSATQVKPKKLSPRRRGVRQGLFFFLLSFLIVPLIAMISLAANVEPYFVFVAMLIFTMGGLLRVAYALMFEEADAAAAYPAIAGHSHPTQSNEPTALPEGTAVPASLYAAPPATGMWRDTNDLQKTPHTVTDSTTKLLDREQ